MSPFMVASAHPSAIISCPQISSHAIKIPNYSLSLCLPLHNFPDMLSFSTLLSYDPFFHTRLKFNIRFKASLILLGNITCPLLYNPRIPQVSLWCEVYYFQLLECLDTGWHGGPGWWVPFLLFFSLRSCKAKHIICLARGKKYIHIYICFLLKCMETEKQMKTTR